MDKTTAAAAVRCVSSSSRGNIESFGNFSERCLHEERKVLASPGKSIKLCSVLTSIAAWLGSDATIVYRPVQC
eukprot:scaffold118966_cov11-Prasinocladus_malaysianus.AAC.1